MKIFLVQGKDRKAIDHDFVLNKATKFSSVILDVGAGDGKGSLRYARKNPDSLVIGLDSSFDALEKSSKYASKKAERGGTNNLLCLYGNIKHSNEELKNIADTTRIYLPWGDLLEGIALVSNKILEPIAQCTKPGGQIEFVINAEIWNTNLPKEFSHLGTISPQFFTSQKEKFLNCGIEIREAKTLTIEEIEALDTTWSAKLMSSRTTADFVMAKGVRK